MSRKAAVLKDKLFGYNIPVLTLFVTALSAMMYFHSALNEPQWQTLHTTNTVASSMLFNERDIQLLRQPTNHSIGNRVYSVNQLINNYPDLGALNIIGDGLTEIEWQQLEKKGVDAQVSQVTTSKSQSPINRLVEVALIPELVFGSKQYIKGKVAINFDSHKLLDIRVIDATGKVVTTGSVANTQKLTSGNLQFDLEWLPNSYGEHYYQLQLIRDQLLLDSQPIAFLVAGPRALNAVLLQAAPSFEFNHLRKWLAQQSFQVFSDIKISSQHSMKQFSPRDDGLSDSRASHTADINKNETIDNLVTHFKEQPWYQLQEVNLVVTELGRLSQMEAQELAALLELKNRGVHIVVIMNQGISELSNTSGLNKAWQDLGIELQVSDSVTTVIPNGYSQSDTSGINAAEQRALLETGEVNRGSLLPPLTAADAILTSTVSEVETLVYGDQVSQEERQSLVSRLATKPGTVTFSRILDSYQWRLSGQDIAYNRLWQSIIEQLEWVSYRPAIDVQSYHIPKVHHPLVLCSDFFIHPEPLSLQMNRSGSHGAEPISFPLAIGVSNTPTVVQSEMTNTVAPAVYSRECRTVYPQSEGWYHVVRGWGGLAEDLTFTQPERLKSFYVYGTDDWQEAMQWHKQQATLKRVTKAEHQQPMNWNNFWRWSFLLIALLALSLLWFRERVIKT